MIVMKMIMTVTLKGMEGCGGGNLGGMGDHNLSAFIVFVFVFVFDKDKDKDKDKDNVKETYTWH